MQAVLFLNVFVILISYFARYKNIKYVLELSFIIIFLFTALRYDFGTDYLGYYKTFNDIKSFSDIFSIYNPTNFNFEKGWLILCYLFKPVGFFGMVFVLSAFICYTYYSLIKKYVHVNYYWLAVLIYVFSFEIMLIQFSAIRQAVSIAIFLNSIKYLGEKRSPVMYVLLILLAGTIHSSAYFMIIFVAFAFDKVRRSNYIGYIIFVSFFGLLFLRQYLLPYLPVLSNIFSKTKFAERFEVDIYYTPTLIGGTFWGLLLIIVLYYSRYQSQRLKYLFFFYSLYFFTYILSSLIFLADRLGYYFAPFCIIVLPKIVSNTKNNIVKLGLIAIFLTLIFYRLLNFFSFDWVIIGYAKYQTIFSAW